MKQVIKNQFLFNWLLFTLALHLSLIAHSSILFISDRDWNSEIYIMDADGSNQQQLTQLGGANFAPYWHPSGEKIVFSSNHHDPDGRDFEIYMINLDGSGLTRITYSEGFDGFPVFSPDGQHLVFGSNRNNGGTSDTNVFIGEWIENP